MRRVLKIERRLPVKQNLLAEEITSIKKQLTLLKRRQEYLEGFIVDAEGKLSESALKTWAEARATPKEKYVSHEEVKKWVGKLNGRHKPSNR